MMEKELIKILATLPKKKWIPEEDMQQFKLNAYEVQDLVRDGTLHQELLTRQRNAAQSSRYNAYRLTLTGEMRIQNYYKQQRHDKEMLISTRIILVLTAIAALPVVHKIVQAVLTNIYGTP